MGATHVSSLLFCLFSFLFGVGAALLHAALCGTLAAFRLLPPLTGRGKREPRAPIAPRTAKDATVEARAETPPRQAPGAKTEKSRESAEAIARSGVKPKKERRFFLGYLLLDLSFFLLFAVCYLLFLFLVHGGIFRLYSLALAALGAWAFRRAARTLVARPVYWLLSLPVRLLAAAFSRVLAFCRRKKPKQLDETDKIV